MKKIPTLFKREFENHRVVKVLPEVTEGLEWVLEDEDVYPTIKIDGSCCAIIDGNFYKRYDNKKGKEPPKDSIRCQEEPDPVTGHWPFFVPVDENNPADKWFIKALFNATFNANVNKIDLEDGTFEAVGKHFNGNPYNLKDDIIVRHGRRVIFGLDRSFEGIKKFLEETEEEGIVFWKKETPICKIKRSDFGFEWPIKKVIK